MNEVVYLGYYDSPDNNSEKRTSPPAAVSKMAYIASVMHGAGYKVQIVSRSGTVLQKIFKGRETPLQPGVSLKLLPTIGGAQFFRRLANRILMDGTLFWTLFKIKKDMTLVAYHSLGYMRMISFLKKIKKFRLILEIEEIYSDVSGDTQCREKELKFFKLADGYLFPTELLNEKINTDQKSCSIVYGTYQPVEPIGNKQEFCERHNWDNKMHHVVYAGTLDPRKGGASTAVRAASLLSRDEYWVHIIGFGSEMEVKEIQSQIEEVRRTGGANVSYDGLLRGDEYLEFLQACDIGLSTQNPAAEFNDTSFPSKILSYMTNGLRVVSIQIPVVERSAVGKYMYYYTVQSPENLAQAIKSVNFQDGYEARSVAASLDNEFRKSLKRLLNG